MKNAGLIRNTAHKTNHYLIWSRIDLGGKMDMEKRKDKKESRVKLEWMQEEKL